MTHFIPYRPAWILAILALLFAACSSSRPLTEDGDNFGPSDMSGEEIARMVPDYSESLQTITGQGRAIVSEPGNNEQVTVQFSSTRGQSLLLVKNRLGMEGGELLSDGDTLLIYNKIDEYVRKIPVDSGELNRIDHLASINILKLLNYPIAAGSTDRVRESESLYLVEQEGGISIYVDNDSFLVRQVDHEGPAERPWSRIIYEGYGETGGYTLPRKITIFSADERSRVSFQIRSLEINPQLDTLTIDLPDDIRIYDR